jgi:hypothetical protein
MLSASLILSGCDTAQQGHRFVKEVSAKALYDFATTNDLERLPYGGFPVDSWPQEFKNAGVKRIQPYFDGVCFVLKVRERHEYGVYVPTNRMAIPSSGSGISFRQIQHGIFWFEEKTRLLSKKAEERARAAQERHPASIHDEKE